ncbi:hypothetical protein [Mesorhizobium australafricanum]|uniref:hypothetical protein n=1 Tax=Mesorhizobium australafricanum TaxID=3072311 RepID=UPI003D314DAF
MLKAKFNGVAAWIRQWLPKPYLIAVRRIPGNSLWGHALSSFASALSPNLAAAPPLPSTVIADQVGFPLALTASGMLQTVFEKTTALQVSQSTSLRMAFESMPSATISCRWAVAAASCGSLSYAGSVITEAGADSKVSALVFVAALQPDAGEASGQPLTKFAAPNDAMRAMLAIGVAKPSCQNLTLRFALAPLSVLWPPNWPT